MSDYETFEQFLARKTEEEEAERQRRAEYEDREWRRMASLLETKQKIEQSRSHHDIVDQSKKIYESPDNGKTVYERDFGDTKNRRIVKSPEEQKINDYLARDKPVYTIPKSDEVYPAREDVPAELWGKNIREVMAKANPDMVNHPPHYNKGIETTTYIDSWEMGFSQGNVIKYVTRYNLKHDTKEKQLEDLKKARWYLDDLIQLVENGKS